MPCYPSTATTRRSPLSDVAKVERISETAKKRDEKIGDHGINAYLCSVKTLVLTTPLSAGSKALQVLLQM